MKQRDKAVLIRMTDNEHKVLKSKARKIGMTVSEYVRQSLIHSQNGTINIIDTTPLKNAVFELTKQGVNLNQFMKFLNTYGIKAFDAGRAKQVLDRECALLLAVENALSALQREAEKGNVFIRTEDKEFPVEEDSE